MKRIIIVLFLTAAFLASTKAWGCKEMVIGWNGDKKIAKNYCSGSEIVSIFIHERGEENVIKVTPDNGMVSPVIWDPSGRYIIFYSLDDASSQEKNTAWVMSYDTKAKKGNGVVLLKYNPEKYERENEGTEWVRPDKEGIVRYGYHDNGAKVSFFDKTGMNIIIKENVFESAEKHGKKSSDEACKGMGGGMEMRKATWYNISFTGKQTRKPKVIWLKFCSQ